VALDIPSAEKAGAEPPVAIVKLKFSKLFLLNFPKCFLLLIAKIDFVMKAEDQCNARFASYLFTLRSAFKYLEQKQTAPALMNPMSARLLSSFHSCRCPSAINIKDQVV